MPGSTPSSLPGGGHGHDHRILQIIDSVPGQHWQTVLTEGITTSVGAEVCARIQSWFSRDQAFKLIVHHIRAREQRGDWPLAPLPAHLIPWVGKAARVCPYRLHPTTIRRLWLADPVRAWHVTQTMFRSGHPRAQKSATAAMDAGWGTGYDVAMATILRSVILERLKRQDHSVVVTIGIATAVAGIERAAPAIIESLLTHLATTGNETVQRQLIQALHRGWGRGQDDLVLRVLAIIADQTVSERVWAHFHETLIRAWDHQPSQVVMHLIDQLLTHGTTRATNDSTGNVRAQAAIAAALAPGWTYFPPPQVIERIAHHGAHLHTHAHTLAPYERDTLVAAWASVIAAGADRLSATDIHALLDPLWALSPHGCLNGVAQGVRR